MNKKRKLYAFVALLLSVLTIANTTITPVLAFDTIGVESETGTILENEESQKTPKEETSESIADLESNAEDSDPMKSQQGESSNANDSPITESKESITQSDRLLTPPSSELETYLTENGLYMDEQGTKEHT
jgi:hypothetical protein